MIKIIVASSSGDEQEIESGVGLSLMEALRSNGIDGVVAECGGSLSCATCHVIVDNKWANAVGEVSDMEYDMLDCVESDRQATSRLSCQIKLSDDLDGLKILISENQI